jgi:uncharacterized protein (TIGR03000 family)
MHGGSPHVGSFHPGGVQGSGFHGSTFHGGTPHVGSFHPGGFHPGTFHPGTFHNGGFRHGGFYGYYPSYYGGYYYPSYGYYSSDGYLPSYSYYPPDDLGYGSGADLGYSYGELAPSYSSGYQAPELYSTASPGTADTSAYVTVKLPPNANLSFDGVTTTATGSVREFVSPPLKPGQYTYAVRARWSENGHDITQTHRVVVSPGAHIKVDFPLQPGPSGKRG